jgi:hypothetical protein
MTHHRLVLALAAASLLTACGKSTPEVAAPATESTAAPAAAPTATDSSAAPATGAPAAPAAFDKTLTMKGITFRVTAANDSSAGTVTIVPSGLTVTNDTITQEIDGTVVGAEVADLDVNGWPELYVFTRSAGSGSYGSVIGQAVNNGKSLSAIFLPDIAEDAKLAQGYMGHDEFAIVENTLARRFPIYAPGDTNAAPSGKMRQVSYALAAGEAGWVLRTRDVTEF